MATIIITCVWRKGFITRDFHITHTNHGRSIPNSWTDGGYGVRSIRITNECHASQPRKRIEERASMSDAFDDIDIITGLPLLPPRLRTNLPNLYIHAGFVSHNSIDHVGKRHFGSGIAHTTLHSELQGATRRVCFESMYSTTPHRHTGDNDIH